MHFPIQSLCSQLTSTRWKKTMKSAEGKKLNYKVDAKLATIDGICNRWQWDRIVNWKHLLSEITWDWVDIRARSWCQSLHHPPQYMWLVFYPLSSIWLFIFTHKLIAIRELGTLFKLTILYRKWESLRSFDWLAMYAG